MIFHHRKKLYVLANQVLVELEEKRVCQHIHDNLQSNLKKQCGVTVKTEIIDNQSVETARFDELEHLQEIIRHCRMNWKLWIGRSGILWYCRTTELSSDPWV